MGILKVVEELTFHDTKYDNLLIQTFTNKMAKDDIPFFKENINNLMRVADTGIDCIDIKEIEIDTDTLPEEMSDEKKQELVEKYKHKIRTIHKKFDGEITKRYIQDFHPECLSHNYDEISKLSVVVRNSDNIIIDPLHRTIPYLTKYEKARILGQRAKQIETGARPLVKIPENIVDSYIIAELELREKKIPFIIRRPIPGGACEYWNLRDLEVVAF